MVSNAPFGFNESNPDNGVERVPECIHEKGGALWTPIYRNMMVRCGIQSERGERHMKDIPLPKKKTAHKPP